MGRRRCRVRKRLCAAIGRCGRLGRLRPLPACVLVDVPRQHHIFPDRGRGGFLGQDGHSGDRGAPLDGDRLCRLVAYARLRHPQLDRRRDRRHLCGEPRERLRFQGGGLGAAREGGKASAHEDLREDRRGLQRRPVVRRAAGGGEASGRVPALAPGIGHRPARPRAVVPHRRRGRKRRDRCDRIRRSDVPHEEHGFQDRYEVRQAHGQQHGPRDSDPEDRVRRPDLGAAEAV
mmetsp:Transcript_96864/g.296100  ORF Transcript_96864/g.296100 Transcript_96864/m.296100 type:complete len:232 (+) Transcript_96864:1052-1747(+)